MSDDQLTAYGRGAAWLAADNDRETWGFISLRLASIGGTIRTPQFRHPPSPPTALIGLAAV